MKKFLLAILVVVLVVITPVVINILQNGIGGHDGRTMAEILGKSPSRATPDDIAALSKAEIMQLFYAAKAPKFYQMNGEYKAELIPRGLLAGFTEFYSHTLMGPGHWAGKAFTPAEKNNGWGYNLFTIPKGNHVATARVMKMETTDIYTIITIASKGMITDPI